MKCVMLEIESKGCSSCVATIIPHLLRLKGVIGAKTLGKTIVVLLEDSIDVESLLENSHIKDYYRVRKLTLLSNVEECLSRRIYKFP
ncbi:MAG: hypothetical protein QXE10_00760 [Desulfurococcaceae archaeon]|jgi:copper chaperone CopZ